MALLQDLRRDLPPGMPWPIGQKPEGSKADRMVAQLAKIEILAFTGRYSPSFDVVNDFEPISLD
jgi:hypothetical protein